MSGGDEKAGGKGAGKGLIRGALESAETIAAPVSATPATDATIAAPGSNPTPATRVPSSGPSSAAAASVDETLPAVGSEDPRGTLLRPVDARNYELGGEHARGGLGRILRARDVRLDRPVAIKELIRPDQDDERRFAREALVTARLQHPAIVPVYEAGRWPNGAPFFAMKLVSGRSLEQVIRETLNLEERLALLPHVIDVVEALAYAHEQRIIHRDVKPANVLVGAYGETVVIDWGLAKDLSAPDTGDTVKRPSPLSLSRGELEGHTVEGSVMGTPAYMPPEQAHGQPVDERADVYALGAVLYHVLSGDPPYVGRSSQDVLMQVVSGPPVPLEVRQHGIPQDLLTIVRKAMAFEPKDRYPTAKELADDLNRFQRGQLVTAHDYSLMTLLRRWLRKHRAPVAVAVVMATMLLVAGVVGLNRIVRAKRSALAEAARAQRAELDARTNADQLALLQARQSIVEYPARTLSWLRRLSDGFQAWGHARVLAADAVSRGVPSKVLRLGEPVRAISWTSDSRYLAASSATADGRTVVLWDVAAGRDVRSTRLRTESAAMAFAPGDTALYVGGPDGGIRVWDNFALSFQTGRPSLPPYFAQFQHDKHAKDLTTLSFSPDAQHHWFATGSVDGTARIWERGGTLASYELAERAPPVGSPKENGAPAPAERAAVTQLAFSPRDPLIASAAGRRVVVWRLEATRPIVIPAFETVGNVTGLVFDTTGRWLAMATDRGEVFLRDMDAPITTAPVDVAPPQARAPGITTLVVAGGILAAGADDGTLVLWDLTQKTILAQRLDEGRHEGAVTALALSADGALLASGGVDDSVLLWNVGTGEPRALRAHGGDVSAVAFAPGGGRLATAGADGVVLLWDLTAWEGSVWHDQGRQAVTTVAWRPDSHALAFATEDGKVRLWDLKKATTRVLHQHERVTGLAFAPDGQTLASSGWDDQVKLWNAGTRKSQLFATLTRDASAVAYSPDGKRLAFAGNDGTIAIGELATGKIAPLPTGGVAGAAPAPVTAIAFGPDSLRLASAAQDGSVRLWDVVALEAIGVAHPAGEVVDLAYSPDGRRVAWASNGDWTVTVWDTESGATQVLRQHAAPLRDIAFSADGSLLASAGADKKVVVWEVETGRVRSVLVGHTELITTLAFSPDGTALVSGGEDDTVRLWDVASGASRALHCGGDLAQVAYSPDGLWVAAAVRDGTVRVFADNLPSGLALKQWLAATRELEVGEAPEGAAPGPVEMLDKTGANQ